MSNVCFSSLSCCLVPVLGIAGFSAFVLQTPTAKLNIEETFKLHHALDGNLIGHYFLDLYEFVLVIIYDIMLKNEKKKRFYKT